MRTTLVMCPAGKNAGRRVAWLVRAGLWRRGRGACDPRRPWENVQDPRLLRSFRIPGA